MQVAGTLTWRDGFRAFLLASSPRKSYAIVGIVLVVVALVALCFTWREYLAGTKDTPSPFLLTGSILFLVLLFGVYYPLVYFRAFNRSKALTLPFTLTIADEGLTFENNLATARYSWQLFDALKESRHLIALYGEGRLRVVVPKRLLASRAEEDQLRRLIKSKLMLG